MKQTIFHAGQLLKTTSQLPEVYEWKAQRGDWLVLACDGVWDTFSSERVVAEVCKAGGFCFFSWATIARSQANPSLFMLLSLVIVAFLFCLLFVVIC